MSTSILIEKDQLKSQLSSQPSLPSSSPRLMERHLQSCQTPSRALRQQTRKYSVLLGFTRIHSEILGLTRIHSDLNLLRPRTKNPSQLNRDMEWQPVKPSKHTRLVCLRLSTSTTSQTTRSTRWMAKGYQWWSIIKDMPSFSKKSASSRSSSWSQWLVKNRTSPSREEAIDRPDGSTSRSATSSALLSRRELTGQTPSLRKTSARTLTRSKEDEPALWGNLVALGQCQWPRATSEDQTQYLNT